MPPASSLFSVNAGAPTAIYRQLMDQVRRLVASGQLTAGTQLPSVREVAAVLAINPMTVSKAYSALEAEGVLLRQRGLGMVVAAQPAAAHRAASRAQLLRPALEQVVAEGRQLGLTDDAILSLLKQVLREEP
jgi:GntR family transcriptional regulator